MVRIVQPQATYDFDFLLGEGGQQRLDGQNVRRHLRPWIESGPCNFRSLDSFPLLCSQSNYVVEINVLNVQKDETIIPVPSRAPSMGWPM